MSDKPLDFMAKRKATIEKKRRSFERLLFQNFLGAYTVLDDHGTVYPVKLIDISHDGCLFEVPWNPGDKKYSNGDELSFRMYFTKESYIPVITNVRYSKEHLGKDRNTYLHYGCEFDQSMPSFAALKHFIDFMYKFAELSAQDHGDSRVYFL